MTWYYNHFCGMKCPVNIFNFQIVKNAANNKADIFIDGDIVDASTQEILKDWFGDETSVSYKSFRNQLLSCGVTDIDVYVNSYGGHVGDAMAMHDMINDLNSKGYNINTYGRGMVCSSATYIVMAGKNGGEVSQNTSWLIHNVSGGIWGNVNEVENYAKTMRKFNNMVVDFYANKTGKPKATISDWMDKETWLIGNEIAANGFVSACTGVATVSNSINAEHWPYTNKAVLNTYNSYIKKPDIMDFQKLKNEILEGVKGLLNSGKKPEEVAAGIAEAVTNAIKANEDDREAAIQQAVNEAITGEGFTNAVNAAVNKAMETVPASVTNAIKAATEGFVNQAKFEQLINDISDKIGKPASPQNPTNVNDPYKDIKVEA